MSSTTAHSVSIVVDGKEIRGWMDYSISSSIIDPVDAFHMSMPWSREAWDLLAPDRPVRVTIDGITVLRGILDERESASDDDLIYVSGRDRVGRLLQESAPNMTYKGLTLIQLVGKLAEPWFTSVVFSNARNRNVLRGRGKRATVGDEPSLVNVKKDGTIIEPGQMRWEVIRHLLEQAGLIAWSSGDGDELIVGKPNYDQAPQWRFFRPAPGSSRFREANASIGVKDSTADRYSRVIVVGSGRGTDSNYGPAVASRYGEAKDNPLTADGTGIDFTFPKRLVIHSSVQSTQEAQAMAARELSRRKAQGETITVQTTAHGQFVGSGPYRTIFCPDTMAIVEDERTGRQGAYLVTGCRYTSNRSEGERTSLELVPKGSELAQ